MRVTNSVVNCQLNKICGKVLYSKQFSHEKKRKTTTTTKIKAKRIWEDSKEILHSIA